VYSTLLPPPSLWCSYNCLFKCVQAPVCKRSAIHLSVIVVSPATAPPARSSLGRTCGTASNPPPSNALSSAPRRPAAELFLRRSPDVPPRNGARLFDRQSAEAIPGESPRLPNTSRAESLATRAPLPGRAVLP